MNLVPEPFVKVHEIFFKGSWTVHALWWIVKWNIQFMNSSSWTWSSWKFPRQSVHEEMCIMFTNHHDTVHEPHIACIHEHRCNCSWKLFMNFINGSWTFEENDEWFKDIIHSCSWSSILRSWTLYVYEPTGSWTHCFGFHGFMNQLMDSRTHRYGFMNQLFWVHESTDIIILEHPAKKFTNRAAI